MRDSDGLVVSGILKQAWSFKPILRKPSLAASGERSKKKMEASD
jgi:hypothetical protein